ncbi:hypothetical protein M422DRAFT_243257 [Sphaerobolus stellatus SS14]|nr:hypothetical protein M422DRAFT_243257 [Sphaerobolus stellatus SS14]
MLPSEDKWKGLLQEIVDAFHRSDIFRDVGKDIESRFWTTYEQVAKQYDAEFLERHNAELDASLIFAGLFSAVSSTFIVQMEQDLNQQPSNVTNALLKILAHATDVNLFANETLTVPEWSGPTRQVLWTQSFAYASLCTSLLAAFGAVLGKQWLGYFKSSGSGNGALPERCIRRQQKLEGLAANLWTSQPTLGIIVTVSVALGMIFYITTLCIGISDPYSPFRSKLTTVILIKFQAAMGYPYSSAGRSWGSMKARFTRHQISHVLAHPQSMDAKLRRIPLDMISSAGSSTVIEEDSNKSSTKGHLTRPKIGSSRSTYNSEPDISNIASACTIQWMLETSTDPEIILIASDMVLVVEWPVDLDVSLTYQRLHDIFLSSFSLQFDILPDAKDQAIAFLKAMFHLYYENNCTKPTSSLPAGWNNGDADYTLRSAYALCTGIRTQGMLAAFSMQGYTVDSGFDWDRITLADIKWLSHLLPYAIQYQIKTGGRLYGFETCIQLITTCLSRSDCLMPVLSDCLLSMALLLGLQMEPRRLVEIDKRQVLLIFSRAF